MLQGSRYLFQPEKVPRKSPGSSSLGYDGVMLWCRIGRQASPLSGSTDPAPGDLLFPLVQVRLQPPIGHPSLGPPHAPPPPVPNVHALHDNIPAANEGPPSADPPPRPNSSSCAPAEVGLGGGEDVLEFARDLARVFDRRDGDHPEPWRAEMTRSGCNGRPSHRSNKLFRWSASTASAHCLLAPGRVRLHPTVYRSVQPPRPNVFPGSQVRRLVPASRRSSRVLDRASVFRRLLLSFRLLSSPAPFFFFVSVLLFFYHLLSLDFRVYFQYTTRRLYAMRLSLVFTPDLWVGLYPLLVVWNT